MPATQQRTSAASSRRASSGLDSWSEWALLAVVLTILVFAPMAFGSVGMGEVVVVQGLSVIALGIWIVRMWANPNYRFRWALVCWPVVAFLVYALIRYLMLVKEGGVEYYARQEVVLVLVYGSLFFIVLNNLARQETARVIAFALLAIATLLSLYALYQFLTKSNLVLWTAQLPDYRGRASATYVCPNHFAGFLEMVLPLGLAYTFLGRAKPITKIFLVYAVFVGVAGIVVSVSRGAWVATALALLFLFGMLILRNRQWLAGALVGVVLIGGALFLGKNLEVFQRRTGVEIVDTVRLEIWRSAYQMWQDHFWFGVGPAQFDSRYRAYRLDDIQMRPQYVHNDYLNTLVDWGTVGTGLIAVTVAVLLFGAFQSCRTIKSGDSGGFRSNRFALLLGATAGLIAVSIHSVVDFNMHIPANAIVAVVLMALLAGHGRASLETSGIRLNWIWKIPLTLVVLMAGGLLLKETVSKGREHQALRRAARAATNPERIQWLKAAHEIERQNPETVYQIGETLRLISWKGLTGYRELAEEAIRWFEKAARLNRFDPYPVMRLGMCLHWLGRGDEAAPYFERATRLDPKNYIVQGHTGWHYFQLGNWREAQRWYSNAVFQAHWHPDPKLKPYDDGRFYLRLIERKLAEEAAPR